jgi:hypothetical protein
VCGRGPSCLLGSVRRRFSVVDMSCFVVVVWVWFFSSYCSAGVGFRVIGPHKAHRYVKVGLRSGGGGGEVSLITCSEIISVLFGSNRVVINVCFFCAECEGSLIVPSDLTVPTIRHENFNLEIFEAQSVQL